nr:unnamed protein product [Callosobruchus analis]
MNDRNSSNHNNADLASGSTNNERGVWNGGHRSIRDKIKLPTMKLPEFYDAYDQWLTIQDIFKSLIHNDDELEKSCLRGEAAQLIQSIKVSNGNHDVAWDLLRSTYEKQKLERVWVLVDKTDLADKLLIHILTSKLDTSTRSKYVLKLGLRIDSQEK